MPHAMVLPLQRVNDAALPYDVGECTHAAFFTLLKSADAALADRLHGSEDRKPFTLMLPPERRRPHVGDTCSLRLTFLDDALFPVLAGALLAGGLEDGLRIGQAQFLVTGLLTTPATHPLAGHATYANLVSKAAPEPMIALRFRTPTVFRSQKEDVLWPEPRLVWGSWARAWQQDAGEAAPLLPFERVMELAARVFVQRFHIRSQTFPLKSGGQTGFVGSCLMNAQHLNEDDRRVLNALADFAFYAGTGRKTAMGMGQTARMKDEG